MVKLLQFGVFLFWSKFIAILRPEFYFYMPIFISLLQIYRFQSCTINVIDLIYLLTTFVFPCCFDIFYLSVRTGPLHCCPYLVLLVKSWEAKFRIMHYFSWVVSVANLERVYFEALLWMHTKLPMTSLYHPKIWKHSLVFQLEKTLSWIKWIFNVGKLLLLAFPATLLPPLKSMEKLL